jgi:hypothetical protein
VAEQSEICLTDSKSIYVDSINYDILKSLKKDSYSSSYNEVLTRLFILIGKRTLLDPQAELNYRVNVERECKKLNLIPQ